jgi:hypothetical protein
VIERIRRLWPKGEHNALVELRDRSFGVSVVPDASHEEMCIESLFIAGVDELSKYLEGIGDSATTATRQNVDRSRSRWLKSQLFQVLWIVGSTRLYHAVLKKRRQLGCSIHFVQRGKGYEGSEAERLCLACGCDVCELVTSTNEHNQATDRKDPT